MKASAARHPLADAVRVNAADAAVSVRVRVQGGAQHNLRRPGPDAAHDGARLRRVHAQRLASGKAAPADRRAGTQPHRVEHRCGQRCGPHACLPTKLGRVLPGKASAAGAWHVPCAERGHHAGAAHSAAPTGAFRSRGAGICA